MSPNRDRGFSCHGTVGGYRRGLIVKTLAQTQGKPRRGGEDLGSPENLPLPVDKESGSSIKPASLRAQNLFAGIEAMVDRVDAQAVGPFLRPRMIPPSQIADEQI
jgi:hypothetical protein